jgi:hypothetical protein
MEGHGGVAVNQLPMTPLIDWVWDQLGTPWELGRNDCVLLGLRAADLQTGSRLAERVEGHYMTWHQAQRIASAHNIEKALREEGWRDAEGLPEVGDLWVAGGQHPTLLVYMGRNFVATVTQREGSVLAPVAAIVTPITAKLRHI